MSRLYIYCNCVCRPALEHQKKDIHYTWGAICGVALFDVLPFMPLLVKAYMPTAVRAYQKPGAQNLAESHADLMYVVVDEAAAQYIISARYCLEDFPRLVTP